MKIKSKFFVVMVVVLTAFCVTLASGTVTTFKTGPFTVSVDLGELCTDINISKPIPSESIGGDTYTLYKMSGCEVALQIKRYDNLDFDTTSAFGAEGVTKDLLYAGADKDAISIFNREINGMPGAVGSAYIPNSKSTFYTARYYVSPKSLGYIYVQDNETKMISALKTIHVTENA
jgi:hypothetical protein